MNRGQYSKVASLAHIAGATRDGGFDVTSVGIPVPGGIMAQHRGAVGDALDAYFKAKKARDKAKADLDRRKAAQAEREAAFEAGMKTGGGPSPNQVAQLETIKEIHALELAPLERALEAADAKLQKAKKGVDDARRKRLAEAPDKAWEEAWVNDTETGNRYRVGDDGEETFWLERTNSTTGQSEYLEPIRDPRRGKPYSGAGGPRHETVGVHLFTDGKHDYTITVGLGPHHRPQTRDTPVMFETHAGVDVGDLMVHAGEAILGAIFKDVAEKREYTVWRTR